MPRDPQWGFHGTGGVKQHSKKRKTASQRRRQVPSTDATLRVDDSLRRQGIWISSTLRQER